MKRKSDDRAKILENKELFDYWLSGGEVEYLARRGSTNWLILNKLNQWVGKHAYRKVPKPEARSLDPTNEKDYRIISDLVGKTVKVVSANTLTVVTHIGLDPLSIYCASGDEFSNFDDLTFNEVKIEILHLGGKDLDNDRQPLIVELSWWDGDEDEDY